MTEEKKFKWVRSIYGTGDNAKEQYNFIPKEGMNGVIKSWHNHQEPRINEHASPSQVLTCPRVIWLKKHKVPVTNPMTWAVEQRLLLGRTFEDKFAEQLQDEGVLLKHWKDNPNDEVDKFKMGSGITLNAGVPDYLLDLDGTIAISDAKTARSDSFGYVGIEAEEMFEAWNYYKYRIQLTNYFMLCEANKDWFEKNGLPMPTHCHLFVYALDDGVVRREVMWQPTEEDKETVRYMTRRYNEAINSETMPECTCADSYDNFDVKFCDYGVVVPNQKISEECCSEHLGEGV